MKLVSSYKPYSPGTSQPQSTAASPPLIAVPPQATAAPPQTSMAAPQAAASTPWAPAAPPQASPEPPQTTAATPAFPSWPSQAAQWTDSIPPGPSGGNPEVAVADAEIAGVGAALTEALGVLVAVVGQAASRERQSGVVVVLSSSGGSGGILSEPSRLLRSCLAFQMATS